MTTMKELLAEADTSHHELLKQLFSHSTQDVFEQMQLIHLRKHQNLISTYQSSQSVFLLLKGSLQAIEERVVDIPYSFTLLQPIDIVGDYELFTGVEGHYVTLNTLEATVCAKLSASQYLHWMKNDANALFLRTQMLMKELSVQTQLQRQYLFLDNRTKLLLLLTRLLPTQGGRLSMNREVIAAQIGCSVRTCNRLILSLTKEGLCSCVHGKPEINRSQLLAIKKQLEASGHSFTSPE